MDCLYTVWFRDPDALPEDEDYEWPACFILTAPTLDKALEWGNYLAIGFAKKSKNLFLKSGIEKANETKTKDLPIIKYGYYASDEEIGW